MKVLVTGASGFIGSYLIEALLKKGYEVTGFVLKSDELKWIKDLKIKLVYGDVTDKSTLYSAVEGADYIYHLAAAIVAPEYEDYIRINCGGMRNVVEACIERGVNLKRLLFVSSVAAMGPSGRLNIADEDCECNPISFYGESKIKAEKELKKLGGKLPWTVVRLPMVYGPRSNEGLASYFKIIGRRIKPLVGNGESNVCYVKDVVKGMILAAEADVAVGKTYILAEPRLYTRKELAACIERALGKKAVTLRIPLFLVLMSVPVFAVWGKITGKRPLFNMRNYNDIKYDCWRCSTKRIEKELGFKVDYDFATGAKETVEWYKQEGII